MYELGCKNAISGVCDMNYINIPDIRKRVVDCGSSMQPDIERIISLKPEALWFLLSRTVEDMVNWISFIFPSLKLPIIWRLRHWGEQNG